jgi:3-hydroxybutyryl-CoA dehydrogenase
VSNGSAAAPGSADSNAGSQPDQNPLKFAIRTVAVIGAGRTGRSFALACVAAGFDVVLEDVMPANLRHAQEEYAELGPANPNPQAGSGLLRVALTVEEAVRTADIAIDFVPDELESKLEIFCLIDRMAPPKTILLTPSDALSITDLASCTYRADRCFALRDLPLDAPLKFAAPLRLLHPAHASKPAQAAVVAFLRTLYSNVQLEPDPDAPMLVKNYL